MAAASKRETVDAKAFRLVNEGRVTWVNSQAARVRGESADYVVHRLGGAWRCSCPWGTERPGSKPCSHVIAAALTAATAPSAPSLPVVPAAPTPAAPAPRVIAEQANGSCACANVVQADLYFNHSQATMLHRVCGRPWARKKPPVTITTVSAPSTSARLA